MRARGFAIPPADAPEEARRSSPAANEIAKTLTAGEWITTYADGGHMSMSMTVAGPALRHEWPLEDRLALAEGRPLSGRLHGAAS